MGLGPVKVTAAALLAAVACCSSWATPSVEGEPSVVPAEADRAADPPASPSRFQGRTAEWWAHRATHWKRRALKQRREWRPTVTYALRLASAVSGVSYWDLRAVSWCESRHFPFATNGRYRGLFQLGWAPFGMSPFDPVANALSAALTVRRDGSWRQWECKPQ